MSAAGIFAVALTAAVAAAVIAAVALWAQISVITTWAGAIRAWSPPAASPGGVPTIYCPDGTFISAVSATAPKVPGTPLYLCGPCVVEITAGQAQVACPR